MRMATNEWTTDGKPMSRIARRFWGGVGQRILDSGALDGTLYRPGQTADETARLSEYDRRWAYYLNDDLYGRLYRAGLAPAEMPAHFNPIPAVVDFYVTTVLAGKPRPEPANEAVDAAALAKAVETVWRWSNFDTLRRDLVVTAAVLGDVFVKVAERAPAAGAGATAVYLQDIPPQQVRWWDVDERGYLTAVRIDTARLESIFTGEAKRHTLVEIWRKDFGDGSGGGVRYYEMPPGKLLNEEREEAAVQAMAFDELGYDFIPVVWERVDTPWRRQAAQIDRYNALAWQAARLNRPLAVVSAGGGVDPTGRPLPAPLGVSEDLRTLYTEEGDGVLGVMRLPGPTTMQWSSSPVDFAALNAMLAELKESIVDSLPEYRVATVKGIQIATETLQLLLNQAEQRALAVRSGLERALSRAQMMAITVAQVAGVEPGVFGAEVVGTYDDGRTEHGFAARPVFEKSSAAKAAEAAGHVASGVSVEAAYLLAGYSPEEALRAAQIDVAAGAEGQ